MKKPTGVTHIGEKPHQDLQYVLNTKLSLFSRLTFPSHQTIDYLFQCPAYIQFSVVFFFELSLLYHFCYENTFDIRLFTFRWNLYWIFHFTSYTWYSVQLVFNNVRLSGMCESQLYRATTSLVEAFDPSVLRPRTMSPLIRWKSGDHLSEKEGKS